MSRSSDQSPMHATPGATDREATPNDADGALNRNDFDRGIDALHAFSAAHGPELVPQTYTGGGGTRLRLFVHVQRRAYIAGTLEPERINALEAVPGWAWDAYAAGEPCR